MGLWPDETRRDAEGRLTVEGHALTDLVAEYGSPLYVYSAATLRRRARAVLGAFQERLPSTRVVYGGKAFLSPAIVRLLAAEGIGLDVVSGRVCQAMLDLAHVLLGLEGVGEAELGLLADGPVAIELGLLGEVGHAQPVGAGHLAGVGVLDAGDDAEDGRLASPVVADEGDVLAVGDLEADAGEDLVRAVALGEVGDGEENVGCHGGVVARFGRW